MIRTTSDVVTRRLAVKKDRGGPKKNVEEERTGLQIWRWPPPAPSGTIFEGYRRGHQPM